ILIGFKGRMGLALQTCAARIPQIEVVGKIGSGDHLKSSLAKADVVIDFSYHDATFGFAEECARQKKALVIGTTGHTEEQKAQLMKLKSQIPIVWSSNYSTGVNALFWLT